MESTHNRKSPAENNKKKHATEIIIIGKSNFDYLITDYSDLVHDLFLRY